VAADEDEPQAERETRRRTVRLGQEHLPRRAVLAAGIGALAAFVTRAIDRPAPVAADGEAVVVGGTYEDVASTTTLGNSLNEAPVLTAWSASGIGGRFLGGRQAVWARGRPGIQAETVAPDSPAIVGVNMGDGPGVVGISNNDIASGPQIMPWSGLVPAARAGVRGFANGVGATGVRGDSASGHGIHGSALDGIGILATSSTGTALQVDGPVVFRTAGLATIRAGAINCLVRPGINITSRSKVLATLQSRPGGTTTVHRVYRNTIANAFTIYLTAPAKNSCSVAWFLLS
jgi:hypothetical protein